MEKNVTIGIDLGTTNSCAAVMLDGQPMVIPNRSGYLTTPSVVAITAQGKRLVGQLAKRQAVTNAANTVFASKRLIGRRWNSSFVQRIQEAMPYTLVEGPNNDIRIKLQETVYSPAEIASIILAELKFVAEEHLGHPVVNAIITVPAYFSDAQRQSTKDAGRMAGLEVLRILNEPTAAALAYGFGKEHTNRRIAVYDLGGGTFDISILEINSGVFDVISTAGDTFLGGEDFDQRVVEWLLFSFAQEHKIDLRKDIMAMQRIRDVSEKARCDLSSTTEVEIHLPFLFTNTDGSTLHLQKVLTREKLESLCSDLVDRTIQICKKTLEEAYLRPEDIHDAVLVGGMTRMPLIQKAVRDCFGCSPSKNVHPDEAVALGAAIQGSALLDSQRSQILLLDVTPHSLGIMIAGGYFQVIIEQNTTIPCSRGHVFTTVKDYQTQVKILVLQGEYARAEENELLGEFLLDGLRPAPRGEVEIEVTFEISSDGIVSVSARDLETNLRQSIVVTATNRLTEQEIQHMMDTNMDFALESKMSEEFERQRSAAETDIRLLRGMLPKLEGVIQQSEFGSEAMRKAQNIILHAEKAIEREDLQDLISTLTPLQRTVKTFRMILDRTQQGG